jgi:hypothetical protein
MLWERCTCTNAGHLSLSHRLSVNVTQVKASTNIVGTLLLVCSHSSFKRLGTSLCQPYGRLCSDSIQIICVSTSVRSRGDGILCAAVEFLFYSVENNLANGLVK